MIDSGTSTYAIDNVATSITIGSDLRNGAVEGAGFNGYFDEVRITAGVARYADDAGFSPPTEAFPRS
ncbi:hypothetical protein YP76_08850 [Sphingobium chungbukense]|uniref:Uncharacterized protein n=2 Tax=Sphingobium chungbukense TaxID=56193 RepID=A0A0M3AVQ0_9SPHN|nr:hypothetical protein YP76_08850 [Sphingobium chungbukense]